NQRRLCLSAKHIVEPVLQKQNWVIRRIGSVYDCDSAHIVCRSRHLPCYLSHPRETHLREKIEIVLIDGHYLGAMVLQYCGESWRRLLKHGIEYCNGNALFP